MASRITNPPDGGTRATRSEPLRQIMAEHRRFDHLLLLHQTLLVEGRPHESRLALARFHAALMGHMRGEEEVILPFYAERAVVAKGGNPDYFEAEHRKLRRLLEESLAWMGAWSGTPWPASEVVFLIEREKVFKEVMEHHDEREDHFLYPGIEDAAGEVEVRGLAERFWEVARQEEERRLAALAEEGGPFGVKDPDPRAAACRAAGPACGWLAGIYEALVVGEERFRGRAPWGKALEKVQNLRRRLEERAPAAAGTAAEMDRLLGEAVDLIEEMTPLKRFPVQRVAEAHSAWHLLRAARRAAQAAAGGAR